MLREKLNTWLLSCLALAVILVYTNTLSSPFIFDDEINIENNPHLHLEQLSLKAFNSVLFESLLPTRPVANLSFALNHYVNGKNVVGYHVVNIVIHIICGLVLYYFVKITLSIPVKGIVAEKYKWSINT